jgi:3-oxoacyl-[acyl-carrier protein] reductase
VARTCGGLAIALDLTSPDAVAEAIEKIVGLDSPLAGVVLAGSPAPETVPFGKISASAMEQQWRVNVTGPQQLLAGLVKACFRPRKAGVVLCVLTTGMADGNKPAAGGMGAYVIAKYGLAGLLDVLAVEYPWLKVRAVRPSFTETPMLKAFDERYLEMMRASTPFATPDEIAARIMTEMFEV